MSNLLRYSSFDLPVYRPETPIAWSKDQIREIGNLAGATAVRRVFFTSSNLTSLTAVTSTADKMFEDIADKCDAQVIDHTWGLARYPEWYQPYTRNHLLPDGLELVAEVDIIRKTRELSKNEHAMIYSHLNAYRSSAPPVLWRDDHSTQFMHGNNSSNQQGLWLIDIEPILHVR